MASKLKTSDLNRSKLYFSDSNAKKIDLNAKDTNGWTPIKIKH